MRKDYTALVERFPFLVSPNIPYPEPDETWLESVPTGWHQIFLSCCQGIADACKKFGVPIEQVSFGQVKEKYGSLRIYLDPMEVPDGFFFEVESLIEEAESKSEKTCCVCGGTAEYHSKGWVLPYCADCAATANDTANQRHKTAFTVEQTFRKMG